MAQATKPRAERARTNGLAQEDVGNIVLLEHVNLTIPDQAINTTFYILGMGFTRDPYMVVGLDNMWINIGEQQFHMPTRGPQVLPGHIGIVVPNLDALEARLASVKDALAGTRFAYTVKRDHVAVTCPWGNQLHCYAPDPRFGDMIVGVPYVELRTLRDTAAGIAQFYERVLKAPARIEENRQGVAAHVSIGTRQELIFRETDEPLPPYDGHHIAIYVANFSGPYTYIKDNGLLMEDIRNHQFRFKDIADPDTGKLLFTLEHEVRGLHHPMYRRPLVNRDAAQSMMGYARGHDALIPLAARR